MEKKSGLQLLGQWIKSVRRGIGLLILVMGTFWLVCALYQLPLDALAYAQLLVTVIAGAYGLFDYRRFVKKYNKLLEAFENLEVSLKGLPEAENLIEESYGQIACSIFEGRRVDRIRSEQQLTEMKDYYTLWAHQIKTPISAMQLLLDDGQLPYEVGSQLEMELFHIRQYVEMVLQYLRLESIASDKMLKPCSLYELVKACVKKYAKSFILRKISLQFEPFEAKVLTDEKWLSFVIEQILSNSLKYTRQGGSITICFEEAPYKKLTIIDTGIGIKEEDLPRIFDRGFTGFNGRMDKHSTGIGLYLCRKITDQLGHQIEVASKLGEGTKISLLFLEE